MEASEHIDQLLDLHKQLTAVQKNEWKDQLVFYINHLLLHDFNKLVQILYRVDVNEDRLRKLLSKTPEADSAVLIADLIIKRQEEKIERKKSSQSNENIPEEDRW